MPNTATLLTATPYRLVYLLTGDGTVVGPTIASATLIANSVAGPLRDVLSATYASQALMRVAMLQSDPCRIRAQLRATPVDTTGQANDVVVDVDTDAATVTRPEVNVEMSDTTGQFAYLEIECIFGAIR